MRFLSRGLFLGLQQRSELAGAFMLRVILMGFFPPQTVFTDQQIEMRCFCVTLLQGCGSDGVIGGVKL